MKFFHLGLAFLGSVISTSSPCCNETIALSISSKMESGMAYMADVAPLLDDSCDIDNMFRCNETDAVTILSNLHNAYNFFTQTLNVYNDLIGGEPVTRCDRFVFVDCSCSQALGNLTELNETYYGDYLPAWNSFLSGSVDSCPDQAVTLREMVRNITCYCGNIIDLYEACRSDCELSCCDQDFANRVHATTKFAKALIDTVSEYNNATCATDSYNCTGANTFRALRDIKLAAHLFNQTLYDFIALYDSPLTPSCGTPRGSCDCSDNAELLAQIHKDYRLFREMFDFFASGGAPFCTFLYDILLDYLQALTCLTQELAANYEACLQECSCTDPSIEADIARSMSLAFGLIDGVGVEFRKQCRNESFSCDAGEISLIIDDLQGASTLFDRVIGQYSRIIGNEPLNLTCCPPHCPQCSCQQLGDQLRTLNASYNFVYTPAWEDYISGYTPDCRDQAIKLRSIVHGYKCLTSDLIQDYCVCQQQCLPPSPNIWSPLVGVGPSDPFSFQDALWPMSYTLQYILGKSDEIKLELDL